MMDPRAVVIVDGVTPASGYLASRFQDQGISCIGVFSSPKILRKYLDSIEAKETGGDSLYRESILYAGDPAAVIRELYGYVIIGILPGNDTGIALADALSERLGLCSNGTRRSAARHDKFLMQQTLIDAGIPTKEFILTGDEIDLIAWYRSRSYTEIVVKPANRGAGRGIVICQSEEEVRTAFHNLIGTVNENGEKNTVVLAEEYLAGTEYCVDTVSRDGQHRLAAITQYREDKPGSAAKEENEEPDPAAADRTELVQYTLNTLDALRIRYGAASTRIMMTRKGPLLIDTAAWMNGSGLSAAGRGTRPEHPPHVDLVVEAYCNPGKFSKGLLPQAPGPDGTGKKVPDR